jgi:hypothetical protein
LPEYLLHTLEHQRLRKALTGLFMTGQCQALSQAAIGL